MHTNSKICLVYQGVLIKELHCTCIHISQKTSLRSQHDAHSIHLSGRAITTDQVAGCGSDGLPNVAHPALLLFLWSPGIEHTVDHHVMHHLMPIALRYSYNHEPSIISSKCSKYFFIVSMSIYMYT